MEQTFTIKGRLNSLNEYIAAMNSNRYKGNEMKKTSQDIVAAYIRASNVKSVNKPVRIKYRFYEANTKRDLDNISSYAHKIIQDALVRARILENDGWKQITGFTDTFYVDKNNPRIVVTLEEV